MLVFVYQDISDLFGADMPMEGQTAQFAWQDGPFLQAMKRGAWILLDEVRKNNLKLAWRVIPYTCNSLYLHQISKSIERHFDILFVFLS